MAKKKKSKVSNSAVNLAFDLPLQPGPARDSPDLEIMKKHLSEQEFALYSQLDQDLAVETEPEMDEWISRLQEAPQPEPDLKVWSEAAVDHTLLLQNELKYLCTILSPEERRNLYAEIYYSLLSREPISHLDLSDMITDCLSPTLARTALVKADADHKYSTAQYMQVYNCLRAAQFQYSLVFGQAMLDGLRAGADSIYWSGGKRA